MPMQPLKQYLEKHNINYNTITHSPAYTAQEIAASAHLSGKDFAKTVIIKVDGELAMVVEPANKRINLEKIKTAIDCDSIEIANEDEFQDRFPECETGAMPPFGNLFNMDVYVDASLIEDEEIAFNSGTHSELMQMAYDDFAKLVQPKIINVN